MNMGLGGNKLGILVKETIEKVKEFVPECPFCHTEMSSLGKTLQPAGLEKDDERGINVVSHVWHHVHEYWCNTCGFMAKFVQRTQEEYLEKSTK